MLFLSEEYLEFSKPLLVKIQEFFATHIFATLSLEEKLILEEKAILEDVPSGLVKSDLTNQPPTPVDIDCCSTTTGQIIAKL